MIRSDDIDDDDLRRLFDYWNSRRTESEADHVAPQRGAIDPLDMTWMLGRIMLIDTAEEIGDFRVRLFGTTIAREFEQDRTGLRFNQITAVDNLEEVFDRYLFVAREGMPHYEAGRTVSDLRRYRGYSRLLLPLSEDGSSVSMILAGVSFFGARQES